MNYVACTSTKLFLGMAIKVWYINEIIFFLHVHLIESNICMTSTMYI